MYKKTIDRIAKEKLKREDGLKKSSERHEKVIDKLLEKAPSEWLDLAIETKARQLAKGSGTSKGKGNSGKTIEGYANIAAKMAMSEIANDGIRDALESAQLPKDGQSPAKSGGTIAKDKVMQPGNKTSSGAQATGKGKVKRGPAEDKVAAKGNKGKAKGKGKNKGSSTSWTTTPSPSATSASGKGKSSGRGARQGRSGRGSWRSAA